MEGGIVTTISSQTCELPENQGKRSIGLIGVPSCHLSFYGVLWCIKERIHR